jgi:transposase-like protein
MKRTRHSAEQIVKKLRDADAMLACGKSIGQVCQALEVSEQTFHRWRNQYSVMRPVPYAPFVSDNNWAAVYKVKRNPAADERDSKRYGQSEREPKQPNGDNSWLHEQTPLKLSEV